MIEVAAAHKRFGSTIALADVDLVAESGRVTAVVGPNGAGKSTLFRAVLGLERLDQGTALIDGRCFSRSATPLQTVGAAIDASMFHPGRRAIDEVRVAAMSQGISRRRVESVLEESGLATVSQRRVKALSLGMRQRLALAIALLGRPRNLILDEPLNGLDVDGIHWTRDVLRTAAGAGCAVLISSHMLSELERVSDRIHILASGRLMPSTTTAGLEGRETQVVAVSDDPAALAMLLSGSASSVTREGRALLIRGMTVREVAERAFRERFFIESLAELQDSLENDYLRLLAEVQPGDPQLRELPGEGSPA